MAVPQPIVDAAVVMPLPSGNPWEYPLLESARRVQITITLATTWTNTGAAKAPKGQL